jgi:phosphoglycerate kinase
MKTIQDMADQLAGKKVLMRVDFNVPLDKETGEISNDRRIRMAIPTIEFAKKHNARVILMSHLGRPKGERNEALSLRQVATRLGEIMDQDVKFSPDCVGQEAREMADGLQDGEILVLENLRFHAGEKKNDPEFAKQLAALADLYVSDAFGTAHRAHASTAGVPEHLPGCAGFLIGKEVENLSKATQSPDHPYTAIMGGAKVSDKVPVIENLLPKVDNMLIGGAMAYTFLKQQGHTIGASMLEEDLLDTAGNLLEQAEGKILLPSDHVCGDKIGPDATVTRCPVDIPEGHIALDIGEETIKAYEEKIKSASLVTWNGPVGYFELEDFSEGTRRLARALAESDAFTIVGGGETAEAVETLGLVDQIDHVSTGGGASLEFLAGNELPGIAALG